MPSSEPIPILFFTASLGGGGAEMHLLRLVNHLDRERFRPILALARPGGSYEPMLRSDVEVFHLNPAHITSSTRSLWRSIKPLSRLIRERTPAKLVSFLEIPSAVAWSAQKRAGGRTKLVCCLQNNFSAFVEDSRFPHNLLRRWICSAYRNADHLISLSQGVANDIVKWVPNTENRMDVVYNAAWDEQLVSMSEQDSLPIERTEQPVVVACGRLRRQKGFPILIEAFALVRKRMEATLWILGQGPDEASLREQVASLGLENDVKFLGFQQNPFVFFRRADLFVLSSLWEGFGNVVVEAMACGTTVLSTDCPYGPAEILENGKHGVLVPPNDAEALGDAMLRLLANPEMLKKFSMLGKSRADSFHSTVIASNYASLFDKIIKGN